MRWLRAAAIAAGCLFSWAAAASPCTVPNTFLSGTLASATQVNANFASLINCFAPIDLSANSIAQTFIDRPGSTSSPAQPYSSSVASQRWELAMGSTLTPITTGGPALRLTMASAYSTNTIATQCNNQPAQVACVAALIVVNQGIATSKGSSIGVAGITTNAAALGAGINDTIGVVGVGEQLGAGIGIGFGGYFQGQRDNTLALAIGIEATSLNSTGADCVTPGTGAFLYTGIGQCDGAWITTRGAGPGININSSAVHIGIGESPQLSKWAEGVTINSGPGIVVTNVSFNDAGSGSTTVFQALGTHTYALATGASAGDFGFGTATPTARMQLVGNKTAAYWGASGIALREDPSTYTDTTSAGATAAIVVNGINQSTIAASLATTYASASTLFIANCPAAGTNVTITACYALNAVGTINATTHAAGGTPGVTCGAAPTAAWRSVGGIVTAC